MKKRLFMVLAVLALMVCVLPMAVGAATEGCPHTEYSTTVHVKVEATCTAPGSGVVYCKGCGSGKTVTIPMKDHNPVEQADGYAATCTATGKTNSWKCACGTVTKNQEDIPMADHVGVEQNDGFAATCTENGKTNSWKCACGHVTQEQTTIKKLDHNYSKYWVKTEATCTKEGEAYYRCSNPGCSSSGRKTVLEVVDCYGIEQNDGYAETCVQNGMTNSFKCKWCGETTQEQHVIDNIKTHAYTILEVREKPTCQKEGTGVNWCSNPGCGSGQPTTIDKVDHTWGEGIVTKGATYWAEGEITYPCVYNCGTTHTEVIPKLTPPSTVGYDAVPKTGSILIEWLYALIFG